MLTKPFAVRVNDNIHWWGHEIFISLSDLTLGSNMMFSHTSICYTEVRCFEPIWPLAAEEYIYSWGYESLISWSDLTLGSNMMFSDTSISYTEVWHFDQCEHYMVKSTFTGEDMKIISWSDPGKQFKHTAIHTFSTWRNGIKCYSAISPCS